MSKEILIEFENNIDFRMLAGQKTTLINLSEKHSLSQREKDDINGIIHFIDSFQDMLVDKIGLEENKVFPYINTEA